MPPGVSILEDFTPMQYSQGPQIFRSHDPGARIDSLQFIEPSVRGTLPKFGIKGNFEIALPHKSENLDFECDFCQNEYNPRALFFEQLNFGMIAFSFEIFKCDLFIIFTKFNFQVFCSTQPCWNRGSSVCNESVWFVNSRTTLCQLYDLNIQK